jgi:hypothetical protein
MVQIQKVAVTQGGLVPLFQIHASHFLWIKKKVRIKQVLQQLKIVINNDLFITQGHSAYLGSATKIILFNFVLI